MTLVRGLRYVLGGLACAAGVALILYGGWLAAFVTSSGHEPYYQQGWALGLAGIIVIGVGAWLCGVDIWRD